MLVALFTVTPVAAMPPKVTADTPVKFVPVMVTLVPPAVLPVEGVMSASVGGAMYVKRFVPVPVAPVFVTATLAKPAV